VERGLGSSLPPVELARWDFGAFEKVSKKFLLHWRKVSKKSRE